MKINRENYEAFFLDYIENRLSPEGVEELHIFLALNPDLDEELRGLDSTSYSYDEEIFDAKASLKKPELPISQEELDELMVKEYEGDGSAEEIALLDKIAAEFPSVKLQRKAMSSAFFTPENSTFEDKASLRFDEQPDLGNIHIRIAASVEGDLDENENSQLSDMIDADPSLRSAKELIERSKITAGTEAFDEKEEVRFPDHVDMSVVQHLLIAKAEGDLSYEQNEKLSTLLAANPSLQEELKLYYQARLVPEEVVYEGKESLLQRETKVIPLRRIAAAASAIAAILLVVFMFYPGESSVVGETASTNDHNPDWKPSSKDHNPSSPVENGTEVPSEAPVNSYKQMNSPSKDVASNENGSKEETSPRRAKIEMLKTRMPAENSLALSRDRGIIASPDMSNVHQHEDQASANIPPATTEPATIWQLLGEAAEVRLEKTAAYALVERQVDRMNPQDPERFKLERIDTEDKTRLKMKLGKIEVSHDTKKRKGFFRRVTQFVDRVISK